MANKTVAVFKCPRCPHLNKRSLASINRPGLWFFCDGCRERLTYNAYAQRVICKPEGRMKSLNSSVRFE